MSEPQIFDDRMCLTNNKEPQFPPELFQVLAPEEHKRHRIFASFLINTTRRMPKFALKHQPKSERPGFSLMNCREKSEIHFMSGNVIWLKEKEVVQMVGLMAIDSKFKPKDFEYKRPKDFIHIDVGDPLKSEYKKISEIKKKNHELVAKNDWGIINEQQYLEEMERKQRKVAKKKKDTKKRKSPSKKKKHSEKEEMDISADDEETAQIERKKKRSNSTSRRRKKSDATKKMMIDLTNDEDEEVQDNKDQWNELLEDHLDFKSDDFRKIFRRDRDRIPKADAGIRWKYLRLTGMQSIKVCKCKDVIMPNV